MRRNSRIVALLVLSLLVQAVVPAAFAACAGSKPVAVMQQMQSHAHHTADQSVAKRMHDCCGSSGSARADCTGFDCAGGGCLSSVTIPVSLPDGVVFTHGPQFLVFAPFLPAAPPAFRFRPPIA